MAKNKKSVVKQEKAVGDEIEQTATDIGSSTNPATKTCRFSGKDEYGHEYKCGREILDGEDYCIRHR